MNIRKIALSMLILQTLGNGVAVASASANGTITLIGGMVADASLPASIYFGISPSPSGRAACNTHNTYQFVFDPSTPDGRALYAALLTVQASGKSIRVQGTGTCILGQPMEGVLYWNFAP